MAHAIALAHARVARVATPEGAADLLRAGLVASCALALILAGAPF